MNIALSAIIIFLLVLPGIFFRYSYRKGVFPRSSVALGPVSEEIAWGALAALVFHAIAMKLIDWFGDFPIDLNSLVILLTQWPKEDKASMDRVWDAIGLGNREYYIIGYVLITNVAALGIGYVAHFIVTSLYLDLIYPKLRFNAEWHYLLSGQQDFLDLMKEIRRSYRNDCYSFSKQIKAILREPCIFFECYRLIRDYKHKNPEPDTVLVSAFVDYEGGEAMFQGTVSDYHLSKKGELETLVMQLWTPPFDPTIEDKNSIDELEQEPPTGYWTVKNSQIITLNIDIVYANEEIDESATSSIEERNAEGTLTATSSQYKVKKDFDEIDYRDFREYAYQKIRDYIKSSIDEINDVEDIKARFSDLTVNSFTCVVINKSHTPCSSHVTVRAGGETIDIDDIYYSCAATRYQRTTKGRFRIESDGYDLLLTEAIPTAPNEKQRLTPQQAAELIRNDLLSQVEIKVTSERK